MRELKRSVRESVAAEIEEELIVRAIFASGGEVGRFTRKESFGEEEDGKDEGDGGANCPDPVIPLPP